MQNNIRIENLQESNIDDLIYVCSSKRLSESNHKHGVELKKRWLREILAKYGSCAKIAYYNGKPVAQILYYPEEADMTKPYRRENVLVINCIYNPTPEAQKLGIGTRLLKSVVNDAKHRKTCLGKKPCKFILAKAFKTGEFLSMPEFYKKNGFIPTPEGDAMYLPMEGEYQPTELIGEYEPLAEDKNKVIIFYTPICQFGYQFAERVKKLIKEVAPNIRIEMINEWEKPEESVKRKNWRLIVNAKPIKTFFMETEKFKEEIKQAVNQNP
jgi:GNAT superfamily N-acetyltransferase/ribosomal protein S16